MEYVTLNNGVKMPLVGYGVFMLSGDECEQCVTNAINTGYRLIDTAQAYYNEEAVGKAIAKCGVSREDLFITTKVWLTEHTYDKARASVLESMRKLQTKYLDLVLIHQAIGNYYAAYQALEDLYKEGLLRAISVSNFSAERMTDLVAFTDIKPAVNQVECHPYFQQELLHRWTNKLGVQMEAWGPLGECRLVQLLRTPLLLHIAQRHRKSVAQVILRYNVQRGIVVIPKSAHVERMTENLDIFDFVLSDEDMKAIGTLDEERSLWLEYDDPNIIEFAQMD